MQRTTLNLVVDLATALAMLGMTLTGYVIRFPLPPGTNKEWMLWGLTRHDWGGIHFWISTILLALILVHVCLHWHWLMTVVRQRLGRLKPSRNGIIPDALMVVAALGLVCGGFAMTAHLSVQRVPESHTQTCPSDSAAPSESTKKMDQEESKLTWVDVYPILKKACVSCHGPDKQRASFRVDRPETWNSHTVENVIVPGDSEHSLLIAIVSGQREIALPGRHRLPDVEVTRLRKWIDLGALISEPERLAPSDMNTPR